MHTAGSPAPPATLEYCPPAHCTHADVPVVAALYAPAAHAVQLDEAGSEAYWPWGQGAHTAGESPPSKSLYRPAAQPVHTDAPTGTALYVPARQAVHTVKSVAPGRAE